MSTRDELADTISLEFCKACGTWEKAADLVLAHLAAKGMVALGPDGDPLDVRPLMRMFMRVEVRAELIDEMRKALTNLGWSAGLFDACLAAAEVDG